MPDRVMNKLTQYVHVFDQSLRSWHHVDLLKNLDCVERSTQGMRYVLDTNRGFDRSYRARAADPHGAFRLYVESESAADYRFTTQPDLTLLKFHELAANEKTKTRT